MIGALVGTPVLLLCGLLSRIVGLTVSVVDPVVNVLWNSGVVWFPARSVTATLKFVLAERFGEGMKVIDSPSPDSTRLPPTFVAP